MSEQTLAGIMSQLVEGFTEHETDLTPEVYKAIQDPLSRLEAAIEAAQVGLTAAKKRIDVLTVLGNPRIDFTRTDLDELTHALADPSFSMNSWTIRIDIKREAPPQVRGDEATVAMVDQVEEVPDEVQPTTAGPQLRVSLDVFHRLLTIHPRIILDRFLVVHPAGTRSLIVAEQYLNNMTRQRGRMPEPTRTFTIPR